MRRSYGSSGSTDVLSWSDGDFLVGSWNFPYDRGFYQAGYFRNPCGIRNISGFQSLLNLQWLYLQLLIRFHKDKKSCVIPLEEKPASTTGHEVHREENPGQKPRSRFLIGPITKVIIFLAVMGALILSVTLFIYGFLVTIFSVSHSAMHFSADVQSMKHVMAYSIEIIDLFLVATVFYIIALGFFELFISKAPLPGWLKISDLDDLKEKLLGLVVIALAVLFLGEALTWVSGYDILAYGLGTAATIIAISVYFWSKH